MMMKIDTIDKESTQNVPLCHHTESGNDQQENRQQHEFIHVIATMTYCAPI